MTIKIHFEKEEVQKFSGEIKTWSYHNFIELRHFSGPARPEGVTHVKEIPLSKKNI